MASHPKSRSLFAVNWYWVDPVLTYVCAVPPVPITSAIAGPVLTPTRTSAAATTTAALAKNLFDMFRSNHSGGGGGWSTRALGISFPAGRERRRSRYETKRLVSMDC